MKFNEKIVRLRKIKGITQDEFANAVGVSRQAVYKWESGQSYPEVAKLLEIKMLFNISIDDLLDDNFEIAMPEKKKRKRLPKPEAKKVEQEVKVELEASAQKEELSRVESVEKTVSEPAPEAVVIPAVEEEAQASAPESEKKEIANTNKELNTDEKKRGFFGRLFGRK